jgi:hypothetical protein
MTVSGRSTIPNYIKAVNMIYFSLILDGNQQSKDHVENLRLVFLSNFNGILDTGNGNGRHANKNKDKKVDKDKDSEKEPE